MKLSNADLPCRCAHCTALLGLPSIPHPPHPFLVLTATEAWADVLRRKRERGAVETYVCSSCGCTLVRDTSPKYSAAWIRSAATAVVPDGP